MLNPGAWTHYAWALRDAVEVAGLPAVEVHLSDPEEREEWRHLSVLADVVVARVLGKGVEGYREGARAPEGGAVSRADRVAARLGGARGRPAARHRPRQHPLPDGLHGLERDGGGGARHAPLHHRLPLRRAREDGGRRLRPRARAAGVRRGAQGGLARRPAAARLRGPAHERAPARAPARAAARADRARRRRRARRGRAHAQGAGRGGADPRRRGARRRHLRVGARARRRRAHRARGRARARGGDAPPRRAPARASPRSWPPARTARSRTRSRATSRSPAGVLVTLDLGAEVDGYCSDCTRTWATGEIDDDLRRDLRPRPATPRRRRWTRCGRARPAARSTPSRATSSPPRATASTSATGSATASGSRSTRARGWRDRARTRSRRATS